MANYTEAEIKAFQLKDQMNCRQSALKAASINNEGLGKPASEIKAEAIIYYLWLYPNGKPEDIDESANETLPTPNLQQKKVLDEIAKKVPVLGLGKLVLEWSITNPGVKEPVYPSNMGSVDKFVSWYNERNKNE